MLSITCLKCNKKLTAETETQLQDKLSLHLTVRKNGCKRKGEIKMNEKEEEPKEEEKKEEYPGKKIMEDILGKKKKDKNPRKSFL